MNAAPEFSVVIASYRRKLFVTEAVLSVKQQTYAAKEIIVVVDGDYDGIATHLRALFPDIKVIVHEECRGPSIAHNTGIAHATCKWVCFLDDDDLWHREKLQETVDLMHLHPEALAINCPAWYFSDESGPDGMHGFKRDFVANDLNDCHRAVENGDPGKNPFDYMFIQGKSFEMLLEKNRGLLSGSCVDRTTLIRTGGFSPMHLIADDWTCFVNVARLTEWYTIPRRLVFYRMHGSQTSNSNQEANLFLLASLVTAWYSGFSQKSTCKQMLFVDQLKTYGATYRFFVQKSFWTAVFTRRFDIATRAISMGNLLLPRLHDKLYACLPPQITWRFERYFLGMHKAPQPVFPASAKTKLPVVTN